MPFRNQNLVYQLTWAEFQFMKQHKVALSWDLAVLTLYWVSQKHSLKKYWFLNLSLKIHLGYWDANRSQSEKSVQVLIKKEKLYIYIYIYSEKMSWELFRWEYKRGFL